ncbi:hypothetical protein QQ045_027688 [Rhodiola kirilowii]
MSSNLMLELSSKGENGAGLIKEASKESPRMDDQMSMLYDNMSGAYDVTELQARAILLVASYETERRMRKEDDKSGVGTARLSIQQLLLCSPVTGLPMKGSLQRFLERRKLRAQARLLPY